MLDSVDKFFSIENETIQQISKQCFQKSRNNIEYKSALKFQIQ